MYRLDYSKRGYRLIIDLIIDLIKAYIKDVDTIEVNPVSVFSLRGLNNFNFNPFRYIYEGIYSGIYSDIYNGIYEGTYYEGISLIEIYIVVINSLLATLIKIIIEIIITSIDIFRLILFKIFSSKINIKEAINSLYTVFYSVFI